VAKGRSCRRGKRSVRQNPGMSAVFATEWLQPEAAFFRCRFRRSAPAWWSFFMRRFRRSALDGEPWRRAGAPNWCQRVSGGLVVFRFLREMLRRDFQPVD
jgi:hypothetical protein